MSTKNRPRARGYRYDPAYFGGVDCPNCDAFCSSLDRSCRECGARLGDSRAARRQRRALREAAAPAEAAPAKGQGGGLSGLAWLLALGAGAAGVGIGYYPLQTLAAVAVAGLLVYLVKGR